MQRPTLTTQLKTEIFQNFYYLKEELVSFCKQEGLQTTGSKKELTERIAHYLDTGQKLEKKKRIKKTEPIKEINRDTIIEENFVCTEKHRAFYQKEIHKNFSFLVPFQKWLKENPGKTYKDSIDAYYKIVENKKNNKGKIDSQFEYNTYIRAFFEDNKDKTLKDAILCWKYKKTLPGHNRYEKEDLQILTK